MSRTVMTAMALATVVALGGAPALSQAQGAAGGKKELVTKLLSLQAPGVEQLATQIAQQPAMALMQQAGAVLQRVPQEQREALGRDIEADVKKYVESAVPIVRKRAVELSPLTIGELIEERFSEDELRQIISTLENPAWRKFQGAAGDMQRSMVERLVADTKGQVDPKLQALQTSIGERLRAATGSAAAAPAPAPAPGRAPAKKP